MIDILVKIIAFLALVYAIWALAMYAKYEDAMMKINLVKPGASLIYVQSKSKFHILHEGEYYICTVYEEVGCYIQGGDK